MRSPLKGVKNGTVVNFTDSGTEGQTPHMRKVRCVGCRFSLGVTVHKIQLNPTIHRCTAIPVLVTKPNLESKVFFIHCESCPQQSTSCLLSAVISTFVAVAQHCNVWAEENWLSTKCDVGIRLASLEVNDICRRKRDDAAGETWELLRNAGGFVWLI